MGAALVLTELAWIARQDGHGCLYIGHPSRLRRVLRDPLLTRRLPATVLAALDAARQHSEIWNSETASVFDEHWRKILEPPYRLVLRADGGLEHLDDLFGVTWPRLQADLRHHGDVATRDARDERRSPLDTWPARRGAHAGRNDDAALWSVLVKYFPSSSSPSRPRYNPRAMPTTFDEMLRTYADLTVAVGLNLQPHQRLLIIGPLANGGVSLDAAPLVRAVAASAYRAGTPLVETLWGDEAMLAARFAHARRDTFDECSAWLPDALVRHVEGGHAVLSIYANDPDQLKDAPPDLVGRLQQATARAARPFREHISRNQTNWGVIAAAAPSWAARVFPDVEPSLQVTHLWDAIARLCRLDRPDPIAAWEAHLADLATRTDRLNQKQYRALHYTGPGTSLTVGLAPGHVWIGGCSFSAAGIRFAPNLPTEEVFTMPHKDRVEGVVRSTKPLSYGGTLIEEFSLRFSEGRVVEVSAARNEDVLQRLVALDTGAARLGEIALVPHSSPVSQIGRPFYNTLFDENAASHVALGAAYKFTVQGGEALSDEEFERIGGNRSATHVDFMIGSAELDVDGVLPDGTLEPVMRHGEWT